MKAVVYSRYGVSADEMRVEQIDAPSATDEQLLVRVIATSVNASDWEFLTATPAYVRTFGGPLRPKFQVLGSDIAGIVEHVGSSVRGFAPGDHVYGDVLGTFGGFAEFVAVPAERMRRKPAGLSFVDAAALPQAACVAYQALRDVCAGDDILINGGGGGSGSFAIQLAKRDGATVTGVDRSDKNDTMRRAGADHVIDYRSEDFTKAGKRYDRIVDYVSSHSLRGYRRALKPGGLYWMVGGSVPRLLKMVTVGALLSLGDRKLRLLLAEPNLGLDELATLVDKGELQTFVERCYPLDDTAEAMQRIGDGLVRGKIVITVADPP